MKTIFIYVVIFFSLISYANAVNFEITNNDSIYSKSEKHRISVEPKLHWGFIIAHSPAILYLVEKHFAMYECTFNLHTLGNKSWHNDYKKSMWGISYIYSDLGNKKYLGGLHALITHFTFPLIKNNNTLFAFRLGTGGSWIEKPFNRLENYKNVAIGSHFNISMSGVFELRKKINTRTQFTTALCLNHYSNGAAKIPNLGINLLSINAGIAYKFKNKNSTVCDSSGSCSKKWKINAIAGGGFKQTIPAGGKTYPVGLIMLNLSKYISTKGKFGFGSEYQYNEALYKQLDGAKDFASLSRIAINVCYEQMIDRLAVVMVLGTYAYSKAKEDGPIYDRIGLRYYCKNNLIVNFSLKTHFANADFLDFGIGYQFK